MVKVDVNGGIIADSTGLGISKGGFSIHAAVHLGCPDAICVMHAHTEASLAVSCYREGLLPCRCSRRFPRSTYRPGGGNRRRSLALPDRW
jgi:ribulose-5-phosphate 4-epimerase/fuculose-1-phosphate aldolase